MTHPVQEDNPENNEFSSVTDILNRQDQSQASKRQKVSRPKPEPIGLQRQDNLLELNSATNPSPKLTANPHLDLDELEKQALSF